jgi:hypothetical protein
MYALTHFVTVEDRYIAVAGDTSVMCSGHPSKYWPRSLQLNLHDLERHSTASPGKLAHWRGSISSLHFSLSQGSFVPKLDLSSLWMFGNATVSIVHNDTPVAPGRHMSEHLPFFFSYDFHCRLRTIPRPYNTHPEEGFLPNTRPHRHKTFEYSQGNSQLKYLSRRMVELEIFAILITFLDS